MVIRLKTCGIAKLGRIYQGQPARYRPAFFPKQTCLKRFANERHKRFFRRETVQRIGGNRPIRDDLLNQFSGIRVAGLLHRGYDFSLINCDLACFRSLSRSAELVKNMIVVVFLNFASEFQVPL
jgi:hypothetical protein